MYSDNLDHTFLQLTIESEADAAPLGLINWFSVHPTSMPRTNQMISGDHKGLASANFERMMNPPGTLNGKVCSRWRRHGLCHEPQDPT